MIAHDGATLKADPELQITGCGPQVKLTALHTTNHGVTLTATTTQHGRLQLSGPGLKTLTKPNLPAGQHTLTLAYTPAGRKAAHAHHKLHITAHLTAGKTTSTAHKQLKL